LQPLKISCNVRSPEALHACTTCRRSLSLPLAHSSRLSTAPPTGPVVACRK
jgi:hypothetical protein